VVREGGEEKEGETVMEYDFHIIDDEIVMPKKCEHNDTVIIHTDAYGICVWHCINCGKRVL
jgi:hypothetical protein